ncbi:MAG TPA: hypothetical protein VJZ91_01290 [Blastocatellia bacterium]|nr:hypothetical protein [Blastocatellia bacterium]
MMIIIAATIFALSLTALFLVRGRKEDPSQLRMPRTQIPTMGVQIVCGDCSGDDAIARKTYLDYNGNCHVCGGHSYILASTLAMQTLHLRAQRAAEQAAAATSRRVIPFDAAARAARSEKIAV